ncbi:MAG: SGNH/GDSL hydrolase family protein [Candidatus Peribacteraceae bacterium]|nr:SGNH/GDSL hydrolase family protein [Candidatus Peribacteraceae bacterium]
MPSVEYAKCRAIPKSSIWILIWFLIWFVLANFLVFAYLKSNYFINSGFDRLLMHPSDNELRSAIYHLKKDNNHTNIILLGDSVIWGVGSNYSKSVAPILANKYIDNPKIQVVNLAVPGNSFLDIARTIEEIENQNFVFLFFINPIRFNEEISNRNFEEAIRFPYLFERGTEKRRVDIKDCCNLIIPNKENEIVRMIDDQLLTLIPIYYYRDTITKIIIGLQPYAAVDAVLSRLRKMEWNRSETDRKNISKDKNIAPDYESVLFKDTNMYNYLATVTKWLKGYNNVYYIVQDNNLYKRNEQYLKNMEDILNLLPPEKTLNMSNKIENSFFIDRSHMKEGGHAIMADEIYNFLKIKSAN